MTEAPPLLGLRERKKAKTRAEIQRQALRLIRKQGYQATTVEQIAEAAEVSPSTFFRYFPNKEEVVLTDEFDPLIIDALKSQPPELGPIGAIRGAMASVFGGLAQEDLDAIRQRSRLLLEEPDLRAAMIASLGSQIQLISGLLAGRAGRQAGDLEVRVLAGAMFGAMMAVVFDWLEHPEIDLFATFDKALAQLEAGASA